MIALVTLVAVALPATAPLYAQVYPGPDSNSINEALTKAELRAGFEHEPVTQFEKVAFHATIVYGKAVTPGKPTVKVAWSNEAELRAQDEQAFVIVPLTRSRQFLDEGTRRPGGGYQLTWSWEVTPLNTGEQTLVLSIRPTVVVEGKTIPELADVNEPVAVRVDVSPAKRDFDHVVVAARAMETEYPGEMTVGEEYDVSASMSMAGHAETVQADIELRRGEESADITITEVSTAVQSVGRLVQGAAGNNLLRRWTVVAEESGTVELVFTAIIAGRAAQQPLNQKVPVAASVRAVAPDPTVLDRLRGLVDYLLAVATLAATLLGLWAAWRKFRPGGRGGQARPGSGQPRSRTARRPASPAPRRSQRRRRRRTVPAGPPEAGRPRDDPGP